MPYIKQENRNKYNAILALLRGTKDLIDKSGELNYLITSICKIYLEKHSEKYSTYNDIFGALDCIGKELYRIKTSDYENKKKDENGDVF